MTLSLSVVTVRISGKTVRAFVTLMQNLRLPYPRKMEFAIPGNLQCGECPPNVPEEFKGPCEIGDLVKRRTLLAFWRHNFRFAILVNRHISECGLGDFDDAQPLRTGALHIDVNINGQRGAPRLG